MFAYDEVPYDTEAIPEAHPRSMATLARLFGKRTAAPAAARVLEIGCADGENLIAAASYLPGARFVGFDLAAEAIARGVVNARAAGVTNVELLHRDVRDVRDVRAAGLFGPEGAPFDYVIAHGVYSWVPASLRPDVLAVMRSALGPEGVGFLSFNAGPGWELHRALRILMREVAAELESPAAKVEAAMALVGELASATGPGFVGILAKAAAEYRAHVVAATPPEAPFSRYVFHDLLAECNDSFTVAVMEEHLHAAGLRILCETPLGRWRARKDADDAGDTSRGLSAEMARTGSPFLQLLVCPSDAPPTPRTPALDVIRELHLWANLAPVAGGALRTTTGAVLRPTGEAGLARAARSAPGFVAVRSLADDEATLAKLEHDLWVATCEGMLSLASEPAAICGASEMPRVATYARLRAREATERNAKSAVLTSALHRSFRVPYAELLVVRELDGATDRAALRARVLEAVAAAPADRLPASLAASGPDRATAVADHVDAVLERFARHGFLVSSSEAGE